MLASSRPRPRTSFGEEFSAASLIVREDIVVRKVSCQASLGFRGSNFSWP
jgi:hypothetical protein